jgi:hypothetical protein
MKLQIAIQRTNLATQVTIELGGKQVTKSIAEWILRRGTRHVSGFAQEEFKMWDKLGDRGIREGKIKRPTGQLIDNKIIRYFDPEERDNKKALYQSEPNKVD